MQWGEQVVKPIFESKNDLEIMYRLATKLGFADKMFKNIQVENNVPVPEDVLREMNRGSWSTGYCGQSPERIKLHMANQKDFDLVTMRAKDGPAKGDYYGLPWPCWGKPEVKHPGTPLLYNTNLNVMDGGGTFRARFGVERDGVNLLAEGSYSLGSEIKDGYPEFTMAVLKKLGWDKDLTADELAIIGKVAGTPDKIDTVSWSLDLSGGIQRVALAHSCVPYGNAKARMNAFGLPDPIPTHREPIYTARADLVAQISDLARRQAVPAAEYRLHGAEGGGGQGDRQAIPADPDVRAGSSNTRAAAKRHAPTNGSPNCSRTCSSRSIRPMPPPEASRTAAWVWVTGAENSSKAKVKALVTERVGNGVAWMPYHFGGWFDGKDLRDNYPAGADPIVLGESANTITSYGYDPATGMQEPKATLCQITAA